MQDEERGLVGTMWGVKIASETRGGGFSGPPTEIKHYVCRHDKLIKNPKWEPYNPTPDE